MKLLSVDTFMLLCSWQLFHIQRPGHLWKHRLYQLVLFAADCLTGSCLPGGARDVICNTSFTQESVHVSACALY